MELSQESFDNSVQVVATQTPEAIVGTFNALDRRISDAREELTEKQTNVLNSVRKMKRQLDVLQKTKTQIETMDIPYYIFQLNQAQSETKISASQTLYVEKIKSCRSKVEDLQTKINWLHARVRRLSKAPNIVRLYLGELNEELTVINNAIKISDYLTHQGTRFADLRASDLNRMFYSLRKDGEL